MQAPENNNDRDRDRDDIRRRLALALAELSRPDRELIEALFLAERAPNEVARELGLSMGALYTRKSRALERLRTALGPSFDGEV